MSVNQVSSEIHFQHGLRVVVLSFGRFGSVREVNQGLVVLVGNTNELYSQSDLCLVSSDNRGCEEDAEQHEDGHGVFLDFFHSIVAVGQGSTGKVMPLFPRKSLIASGLAPMP